MKCPLESVKRKAKLNQSFNGVRGEYSQVKDMKLNKYLKDAIDRKGVFKPSREEINKTQVGFKKPQISE